MKEKRMLNKRVKQIDCQVKSKNEKGGEFCYLTTRLY